MADDLLLKGLMGSIEQFIYASVINNNVEAARFREETHTLLDLLLDQSAEEAKQVVKNG